MLKVLGVLLILGGAYLLWKPLTYATRHDVLEVGEFKASFKEETPLPPWVGGGLVVVGIGCLLVGSSRSRAS